LPWTESGSRDEWLAEVTRRGEQIRRRRRLAVSGVGAVALLAPVIAVASLTAGGRPEHQLQVAAEGPAPTTGSSVTPLPSVISGEALVVTSTTLAAPAGEGQSIPPAPALYSTTTTEVHRRVSAVNGVPSPTDDPVIRPTIPPTTVTSGNDSVRSSPTLAPTPNPTLPSNDPSLEACPVDGVRVTVSIEKPAYASGEIVRWSSTIENRSATTCLMSGRAFFHVENTAGKIVGSFAYTANYMLPVKAEPGKTISESGSWNQQDCSGSACVQVPAGGYVVVAGWTEGGPYVGRGSFQIGG